MRREPCRGLAGPATVIEATSGEWKQHWPLVLAAGIGYGLSTTHTATMGAMVRPLTDAFGWSRGQITGGLVFFSLFGIISFPLIGRVVDLVGSRRVALAGACLYAAALAGIGLSGPSVASWFLAWGVLAFLYAPMSTNVWTKPVVGRFHRQRGLALGLVLTGSGIVNTIMPPLAVAITATYGWRGAYFVMAALVLAVLLPSTFLFFRDMPGKAAGAPSDKSPSAAAGVGSREALRDPSFWKLIFSISVTGGVAIALQVHLQPMFIDGGLTPFQAAGLMSIFGPALIVGRILIGLSLDRFSGRLVSAVTVALPVLSMLLMLEFDGAIWRGALAALVLGFAYGAEVDLIAYLCSRYFGLKNYSTIYGMLLAALVLGLGVSPGLLGLAFDHFGSYSMIFIAMMTLSCLAAVTVATLPPYPQFQEDVDRSQGVEA